MASKAIKFPKHFHNLAQAPNSVCLVLDWLSQHELKASGYAPACYILYTTCQKHVQTCIINQTASVYNLLDNNQSTISANSSIRCYWMVFFEDYKLNFPKYRSHVADILLFHSKHTRSNQNDKMIQWLSDRAIQKSCKLNINRTKLLYCCSVCAVKLFSAEGSST